MGREVTISPAVGGDGVIVSITCWLPGTAHTEVPFERLIRTKPDGRLYEIARGSFKEADTETRSARVNGFLAAAFELVERQLRSPTTWIEERAAQVRVYITIVSGPQSGEIDLHAIAVAPWAAIGAVFTIDSMHA